MRGKKTMIPNRHIVIFDKTNNLWNLFKLNAAGEKTGSEIISELSLAEVFLQAKELQIPTWSITKIKE